MTTTLSNISDPIAVKANANGLALAVKAIWWNFGFHFHEINRSKLPINTISVQNLSKKPTESRRGNKETRTCNSEDKNRGQIRRGSKKRTWSRLDKDKKRRRQAKQSRRREDDSVVASDSRDRSFVRARAFYGRDAPPWSRDSRRLHRYVILYEIILYYIRRDNTIYWIRFICSVNKEEAVQKKQTAVCGFAGTRACVTDRWNRSVFVGHSGSAQSRSKIPAGQQNPYREMKEAREGGLQEARGSWTDAIYNRRSGEILGRTSSSWGELDLWSCGCAAEPSPTRPVPFSLRHTWTFRITRIWQNWLIV